jgi:hypothetical protein
VHVRKKIAWSEVEVPSRGSGEDGLLETRRGKGDNRKYIWSLSLFLPRAKVVGILGVIAVALLFIMSPFLPHQ